MHSCINTLGMGDDGLAPSIPIPVAGVACKPICEAAAADDQASDSNSVPDAFCKEFRHYIKGKSAYHKEPDAHDTAIPFSGFTSQCAYLVPITRFWFKRHIRAFLSLPKIAIRTAK
jgi:hypothetical protein